MATLLFAFWILPRLAAAQADYNGVDLSGPMYAEYTHEEKLALVDIGGPTFARLSADDKALLEEYRSNYLRVKRFYRDIEMKIDEKLYSRAPRARGGFPAPPDAAMNQNRKRHYHFYARSGSCYRLDGTEYDVARPSVILQSQVGLITPSESYHLLQNPSSRKYSVAAHGKATSRYTSDLFADYWFLQAAYSFHFEQMEHLVLINRPGFLIESIRPRLRDGDRIVTISLSWRGETSQYEFDLLRDQRWALREGRHHVTASDGERLSYTAQHCVYRGKHDGVPILSECWREQGGMMNLDSAKEPITRERFSFTEVVPGPPNRSLFDVSSLITPVADKTDPSRFTIVSLAISVALLLIVAVLKRRQSAVS